MTGWHAEDPQSKKIDFTPPTYYLHPDEDVKDTNSNAEGSRGDLSSPIPEPEAKSTKVVHELSSSPTEEPSRKRRKEKESSRKKLKEYLNNFEDEIICPMSGSEHHSMISTF